MSAPLPSNIPDDYSLCYDSLEVLQEIGEKERFDFPPDELIVHNKCTEFVSQAETYG